MGSTYTNNDFRLVPMSAHLGHTGTMMFVRYMFPEANGNSYRLPVQYDGSTNARRMPARCVFGVAQGSFHIQDNNVDFDATPSEPMPQVMDAHGVTLTALEDDSIFFCVTDTGRITNRHENKVLGLEQQLTVGGNVDICVVLGSIEIGGQLYVENEVVSVAGSNNVTGKNASNVVAILG